MRNRNAETANVPGGGLFALASRRQAKRRCTLRIIARYHALRAWKQQAYDLPNQVSFGPSLDAEEPRFRARYLEFEAREVGGKLVGEFVRDPAQPGRGRGWILMAERWIT